MVLQNKATIVAIALSSIAWLIVGDYVLMTLMALVVIVSYFALQKPVVLFMDEGITYPSFPKKNYPWSAVNQVILKSNILTIDLKNNQLMQFTLPDENLVEIEEGAFNEFCAQRISA